MVDGHNFCLADVNFSGGGCNIRLTIFAKHPKLHKSSVDFVLPLCRGHACQFLKGTEEGALVGKARLQIDG